MAVLTTIQQKGNREDLINTITMISPKQTPWLSSMAKTKATAVSHEFMTDSLAPPADNAELEGSVAAYGALTPRVRLSNACQILRATGEVSDTQEAVLKAGVTSEYANQIQKATKEFARDAERALWHGTKVSRTAAVAGRLGGFFYWTTTNRKSEAGTDITGTAQAGGTSTTIVLQAGHGAASSDGDQILITGGTGQGQYRVQTGAAATDTITVSEAWHVIPDATSTYIRYDAPTALSETVLNDALQSAADAGGEPDTIYVDGKQKRAISDFASGNRRLTADGQSLTNSIDVYESDFGKVSVKYNRWSPYGTAAIVESGKWKTAWLRPIVPREMPKVGSSRRFMIEGEFTLEALAENANAMLGGCL